MTEQVYDQQGRVVKLIAPDGSFTQTEYDLEGRVKAEIDPLGRRKDFTYNSSGQLASVQLPAVPNPLNGNTLTRPTYHYQYNEHGQMSKLTDANGHATQFGFTSRGQSSSRTLPEGNTEQFFYDARQRQHLHVSFEGVVKQSLYDDSIAGGGRMLGYNLFASQADYDAFQNSGVLAAGVKWEQIRLSYDAQGRSVRTEHLYVSGASGGAALTVETADVWTSSFDDQGRLTQETSPTGFINYQYDSLGRKTLTQSGTTVPVVLSEVSYTYDLLGRLSTVSTVKRDGAVVDSDSSQAGNQPETTAYHYDMLGRPDYTVMPNSVVEDFSFDNMDRLDVMRHFQSDSTTTNPNGNADLSDNLLKAIYDYSYTADGKRDGMVEKFGGSGIGFQSVNSINDSVLANHYTWSYDDAGRLISEELDSSDNTLDQTESFLMDLVGNRLRRTIDKPGNNNDTTDIYVYDSNDRLQSENRYAGVFASGTPTGSATKTTAYTWNNTQQSSKTVAVPTVSSVVQSMSYGLAGQLERVITTTSDGSSTVESRQQVDYRYDTRGIRFIAIDTTDTNLSTSQVEDTPTSRTEYLIDHANFTGYAQTILESHFTADAHGELKLTKRISYTFGTDEITQTTSLIDPSSQLITQSSTLTFGHDGHGSVRVLFEAAAALAQVFTYSAYGELLSIHNAAGTSQALNSALTSVLYNGESFDSKTGLYNFRARWYDSSIGRFADRLDPFAGNPSDPFSFNKYGFVHGNPVMGIDPSGLMSTSSMLAGISIAIPLISMTLNYIQAGRHAINNEFEQAAIYTLMGHIDAFATFSAIVSGGGGGGSAVMGLALAGGVLAVRRMILAEAIEFTLKHYGTLVGISLFPIAIEAMAWMGTFLMSQAGGSPNGPNRGKFEYSEGPGAWWSDVEKLQPHAAAFQKRVAGKPEGWIYWLKGKKFDAYRPLTGELLDAKSTTKDFYVRALTNTSLRQGFRNSGGYKGMIDDLVEQREIAESEGLQFVIEVETPQMVRAFSDALADEGIVGIIVRVVSGL